jgi:hypothetical protein
MRVFKYFSLIAFAIVCSAVNISAQKPDDVMLTVTGDTTELKMTRAGLDKFTRQKVRAKDHDGKEYTYEGVAIIDILEKVDVKFGAALRGKALASYLLVEASDGYRAVYALPELDPPTADRMIILADRRDGASSPANSGPLQVIVPGDKEHGRWVRQVKSLMIMRAPLFRM